MTLVRHFLLAKGSELLCLSSRVLYNLILNRNTSQSSDEVVNMKVQFIGAAQTVTGSKTYLQVDNKKILIDCGMYQGIKSIVDKNYNPFSFDPAQVQFLFLTHAHLDHCGMIPRLYKQGFKGKILCTRNTRKLAEIIMMDSARIQQSAFLDFKRDKKVRKSLKKQREALYDENDVRGVLECFETYDFDHKISLGKIDLTFRKAGHILGASSLEIHSNNMTYYFSGDLGRMNDPLEYAPYTPKKVDHLFIETTYGDRLHDKEDPVEELAKILKDNQKSHGRVLIPSFAVARTQLLLRHLYMLFEKYPELKLPIYIDSPMTKKVTDLYLQESGELRVDKNTLQDYFSIAKFLKWQSDYKKLERDQHPCIIISASGMLSGGKVLQHLNTIARNERNHIVLVGFQGEGTLGRDISQGIDIVKTKSGKLPIRAKVHHLHTLSAHADKLELESWIKSIESGPTNLYLMHGEKETVENFKTYIDERFNCKTTIAVENKEIEI